MLLERQALSSELIYKLILLNYRIRHTLIVMSRCYLAPSFWHWSKFDLLLCCKRSHVHAGCTILGWEARDRSTLFLGWQNRSIFPLSLSAGISKAILNAAFGSKELVEGGGEIKWLPLESGRHSLLYKLYLHNERLLSYGLGLTINPSMS
jgi:hypothetical protein